MRILCRLVIVTVGMMNSMSVSILLLSVDCDGVHGPRKFGRCGWERNPLGGKVYCIRM